MKRSDVTVSSSTSLREDEAIGRDRDVADGDYAFVRISDRASLPRSLHQSQRERENLARFTAVVSHWTYRRWGQWFER